MNAKKINRKLDSFIKVIATFIVIILIVGVVGAFAFLTKQVFEVEVEEVTVEPSNIVFSLNEAESIQNGYEVIYEKIIHI